MVFGRKRSKVPEPVEVPVEDHSAWLLDNPFAEFLLMHTPEIKYMCMLGYTFLHGYKVFSGFPSPTVSTSFKFVSLFMACTGGGIMVPIFLNGIPVPLANDAYPIAIMISFAIHQYFPILREIMGLSYIMKGFFIVLYETTRAYVVVLLTTTAAAKIPPSLFSFSVFGPIICGGIGGCGGAFLPLNKGLEPIKKGLASPMFSALLAAAALHLFLNTRLSDGIVDAKKKAHVNVAVYFIGTGLFNAFGSNFKQYVTAEKKKN